MLYVPQYFVGEFTITHFYIVSKVTADIFGIFSSLIPQISQEWTMLKPMHKSKKSFSKFSVNQIPKSYCKHIKSFACLNFQDWQLY